MQARQGFTLIETLIYLSVVGGIIATFVSFSFVVQDARTKTLVISEVQANGRFALDVISQRIRAATGVNTGSSTFDSDPGTLSLAMAESSVNPTVFNLSADNGTLQITEGVGSAVELTSDDAQVTNLTFTNLTDGDREHIRVQMTIGYTNTSGSKPFTYTQDIQTSVSVRQ
jgi:Tfp pilus assembly protein PilW